MGGYLRFRGNPKTVESRNLWYTQRYTLGYMYVMEIRSGAGGEAE